MNARLGFAVAAHLEPDVLIIDEVLSVGDMAFQQRCVERMQYFKRQGVAIVFVSHNLQAVESLCDNALFLHGEPRALGPTSDVLQTYLRATMAAGQSSAAEEVQILGAQLLDASGEPAKSATPGELLALEVRVHVKQPMEDLYVGFMCLRSTDLLVVYDGHFHEPEVGLGRVPAGHVVKLVCRFRAHLTRGHYHLACQVIHGPTQRVISKLAPAAMLVVEESRTYAGVVDLDVRVDRVDEGASDAAPIAVEHVVHS
jgi:ABC-type glutathione transport system ATPase component